MHNYIHTPNLDQLVQQSTEFSNFYSTPMCTTTRAELLTGRYYPRTGSMYINTGWDFLSPNETTIAEVMSSAGYKTVQLGKWHNGRTAGYQPQDVGFEESFMPTPYIYLDNLMYINRKPVQTKGWMEDVLMGFAIDYLKERQANDEPFFMYYPAFSVHAGWLKSSLSGPRYQRPAPPKYIEKYLPLPISDDTAHLYAMLEYIDYQIGRLVNFLEQSGLAETTYIMLSGDNGPALFSQESKPVPKEIRMPSGMQGAKHLVLEGGIRNFLAVKGPGVAQGVIRDELLGMIDVLPTIVQLARIQMVAEHAPWDGLSFVNLIIGDSATQEQQERFMFSMQTQCLEEDFVPMLGADRQVLLSSHHLRTKKPQPLLDYTSGGVSGLGFKRCIGVRYKNYKWLGNANATKGEGPSYLSGSQQVPTALYKFNGDSHVELPCQEVSKEEPEMTSFLEAAAEAWFKDMVSSEHSFERPVFFMGIGGRPGVNIVADATAQRTPGRIQVLPMGLSGFVQPGDSAWYRIKVAQPGLYEVTVMYQSDHEATFRLWAGPHNMIRQQRALSIEAILPASLPQTAAGRVWEIKLELTKNSVPGKPVVEALDNIVFKRLGADGLMLPYDPNNQEGVRAWKVQHGYSRIQGGH
eukprot:gene5460-5694_t